MHIKGTHFAYTFGKGKESFSSQMATHRPPPVPVPNCTFAEEPLVQIKQQIFQHLILSITSKVAFRTRVEWRKKCENSELPSGLKGYEKLCFDRLLKKIASAVGSDQWIFDGRCRRRLQAPDLFAFFPAAKLKQRAGSRFEMPQLNVLPISLSPSPRKNVLQN